MSRTTSSVATLLLLLLPDNLVSLRKGARARPAAARIPGESVRGEADPAIAPLSQSF